MVLAIMTQKEKVDELLLKIEDINVVDEILNIYSEDSINNCELIDTFYQVYTRIYNTHGSDTRFKEMAMISKRYSNSCPSYQKNYRFYYILSTFYYKIGDYEQCAGLMSKFMNENVPPDYTIGAYTIQLNIFLYLGLYVEAQEILEEMLSTSHMEKASNYAKGIVYTNAITIACKNSDKESAQHYYDMLLECFGKLNFSEEEKDVVIKTSYYYLMIMCNLNNLELAYKYADEFYEYIMNNNMKSDLISQDCDTYLSIIESMKDHYSDKQVFDILTKILNEMKPMYRDELMYYNYLFKTNNKYYFENTKMHVKHMRSACIYYDENREHYADSLREVLRLHLIEDKLNILESKYNIDFLTGCLNRNYLIEIENDYCENGAIIYIDLDKLKQVNDNFGHHNGDMYLKVFANLLKKVFSGNEYQVIRYGGDEFVIICKNVSSVDVINLVNELNRHAKEANLKTIRLNEISFSSGIKLISKKTTIKEAVSIADELMYKCKNSRKNSEKCYYVLS